MTRHSYIAIAVVATALIGTPSRAAEKTPEPLAIKTSGAFAPAETDVIVRMRVEPNPRVRTLTLEWVSDDLSGGSHLIALDGGRAPITHQYAIKRLAAGDYVVTAILGLDDGTQIRRASKVTIVGVDTVDMGGADDEAQGSARTRPGRR